MFGIDCVLELLSGSDCVGCDSVLVFRDLSDGSQEEDEGCSALFQFSTMRLLVGLGDVLPVSIAARGRIGG